MTVTLSADVVVVVQGRPSTDTYHLTCSASHEAHFRIWEAVSISLAARAPAGQQPTVLSG